MENKKILEKDIQKDILLYLDTKGYFFWRSNNIPVFAKNNGGKYMYRSLPKYTPRGLPDIIVITQGKFVAIEVKRDGAQLSEYQASYGLSVVQNGGEYVVVHSVEEVDRELARIETDAEQDSADIMRARNR